MPRRGLRTIRKEFFFYLRESKRNDWDHKRPCYGREDEYALYEQAHDDDTPDPDGDAGEVLFVRYEEEGLPTAEEAEAMCAGCPVLALCKEYGDIGKFGSGIWGGVRWVDGKPVLPEGSEEELGKIAS